MPRRRSRPAYTLIEIMLVMAILVVAAAIIVPSLRTMYGPYKLNGAVDSVRGAWALAKSYAADQGRPYRFAVEPNGRHFRVAPDDDSYWNGGTGPSDDPLGKGMIHESGLPAGVTFVVNGEPGQPAPSTTTLPNEETPASGSWDKVCVFTPDGFAGEDVRISFQVTGASPVQLELRGLTGIAYTKRPSNK